MVSTRYPSTSTRPVHYNGRSYDVPMRIRQDVYRKRRKSGMTHEDAITKPSFNWMVHESLVREGDKC